jgi:hypothetical protein
MVWFLVILAVIVALIIGVLVVLFRESHLVDERLFREFNELAHYKGDYIIKLSKSPPLRVSKEYVSECPEALVVLRIRHQGTFDAQMNCSRGTLGLIQRPDGKVLYSNSETGPFRYVPANLRELVHDTFEQLKRKAEFFERTQNWTGS